MLRDDFFSDVRCLNVYLRHEPLYRRARVVDHLTPLVTECFHVSCATSLPFLSVLRIAFPSRDCVVVVPPMSSRLCALWQPAPPLLSATKTMFRRSFRVFATTDVFQGFKESKNKFFTSLWNKPQTRDERVKEYVPEVLEESLEEQRAVIEETNARDVIVEIGHKILLELENKSPTPTVSPQLNKLLAQYGVKEVIPQRALSYLLYPNSSALGGGEQPHELIGSFPDHFRTLIEEVERNGCSVSRPEQNDEVKATQSEKTSTTGEHSPVSPSDATREDKSGPVIMASAEHAEPVDITMFVKVVSAMAMANLHCGDVRNAIQCVDAGIAHARDPNRVGGLLGLKAGLLCQSKRFEEAAEAAELAVESSGNIQGYLHGAHALRMLQRPMEAVALLERGREDHPMSTAIADQIETTKKAMERSLPAGTGAGDVRHLNAGRKTAAPAQVES